MFAFPEKIMKLQLFKIIMEFLLVVRDPYFWPSSVLSLERAQYDTENLSFVSSQFVGTKKRKTEERLLLKVVEMTCSNVPLPAVIASHRLKCVIKDSIIDKDKKV